MNVNYEKKAYFCENAPYNPSWDKWMEIGNLSLSDNDLFFEFEKNRELHIINIKITDIQSILKKTKKGKNYIKIFTYLRETYSLEPIKKKLGRYISDKHETEKLYDLIFKLKFKELARKSQNKFPITELIDFLKSSQSKINYCYECGESVRERTRFCFNCGNHINSFSHRKEINYKQLQSTNNINSTINPKIEDDHEKIDKLKEIMEISTLVRLDALRNVLDLNLSVFYEKIIKWAKKFGFIIDGDYLITDKNSLADFLSLLNNQNFISNKLKKTAQISENISCINCNSLIESKARICPYCGINFSFSTNFH